jgi:hypothetical protein
MRSGLLLAVAFLGLCESAIADDVGPYAYGSAGVASAKKDPVTYKVNFGYQLGTSLAFQTGYGSTASFRYSGSASATEQLQIWDALICASHSLGADFALTLRGGIAHVRAVDRGTAAHFSGSSNQGVGGVGVKYLVGKHLSLRLDWDGYKAPSGSQVGQVNFFSAGIGYNF